jgi:hypothetical protein
MSKKQLYRPVLKLECHELPQENHLPDDDFLDTMNADIAIGIAAQDHCKTREELVAYTRDAQLAPYLRFFLERRGWLDDDWTRRLDQLNEEFQRQVN